MTALCGTSSEGRHSQRDMTALCEGRHSQQLERIDPPPPHTLLRSVLAGLQARPLVWRPSAWRRAAGTQGARRGRCRAAPPPRITPPSPPRAAHPRCPPRFRRRFPHQCGARRLHRDDEGAANAKQADTYAEGQLRPGTTKNTPSRPRLRGVAPAAPTPARCGRTQVPLAVTRGKAGGAGPAGREAPGQRASGGGAAEPPGAGEVPGTAAAAAGKGAASAGSRSR